MWGTVAVEICLGGKRQKTNKVECHRQSITLVSDGSRVRGARLKLYAKLKYREQRNHERCLTLCQCKRGDTLTAQVGNDLLIRGASARSSDEAPVMGVERRGIVNTDSYVNRKSRKP